MTSKHKSLKIGLVLDDTLDTPDGVQQYVLAIGEWLRSHGHDVRYLVGKTDRTDIAGIHSLSKNVKVTFNGNRMSMPLPTSKRKLQAFLQVEKFDVLHIQMPYSPYMAHRLVLAAPQNTAIIGTFHILPNSRVAQLATKVLGVWTRSSQKRFDAVLSVSSAAQTFAKKTFGVNSIVVPNVVDYSRFSQAKPFARYVDDTPTILYLGRLVPRKGCKTLLHATKLVISKHPELVFRVVVCGKGPLLDDLQQYVTDNKLETRVSFIGFVTEADKPRYLASARIAAFPSSGGESFGIVLLEGMASGNALVLAGDNPGYRSVIGDKPELLFNPRSPQALADKIVYFLQSETERLEYAAWGKSYTKGFDVSIVGDQIVQIYNNALHKRREQ